MTLSSRHRIRNSNPGGLRPSTLPLGHGGSPQYWLSHVDGEETFFVSFKPPRPGTEPRTLACKAAVLTTTLGPLPSRLRQLMYACWKLDKTNVGLRILEDSRKHYCSRFRQGYAWFALYKTMVGGGGGGGYNTIEKTTVRISENTMPANSFVNCCPLFTSTKYKKRKRILVC